MERGVAGADRARSRREDPDLRRAWLRERWDRRQSAEAKQHRAALEKWYGQDVAADIKYAEVFEICEYGHQPSDEEVRRLFPFLPDAP